MSWRLKLHHRIVIPFAVVAVVAMSASAFLALSVVSREFWPAGIMRRAPPAYAYRHALTLALATGSPNSSVMRPPSTLPRGSAIAIFSIVWPSPSSIGVPDSDGRRCPYCSDTKPPLLAVIV